MHTRTAQIWKATIWNEDAPKFYQGMEEACKDLGLVYNTVKQKPAPFKTDEIILEKVQIQIDFPHLSEVIADLNASGGETPAPAGVVTLIE